MKKDLLLSDYSGLESMIPVTLNTYYPEPDTSRYWGKGCTICGNIYQNRTFRGGYICEDCVIFVREM